MSAIHGHTLVLGGARSGKSAFAERLALGAGTAHLFVATAVAGDGEMAARIAHHRDNRGPGWTTIEEQTEIADVIVANAGPSTSILVDCLTLWLSNLMHLERDLDRDTDRLTAAIRGATGTIVVVSNEVGLGIVPETPLGRRFRDAQGRLNQAVAAVVPNVVLLAAGLPLWLKRDGAGAAP